MAHYYLAKSHFARQEYAEAVQSYEKSLQLDPTLADAHYNLGIALAMPVLLAVQFAMRTALLS